MPAMASPGPSKRKVLLAITIAQQAYYRGIVRYAREHDWHLVTDMTYTGRVPLGWRGDGILTVLGYRRELVDFIRTARLPTVAITLVNDKVPLPRVEGDNRRIGQLAAEHFLERGYRHFAWAPFLNDVMNAERLDGFARTIAKRGYACRGLPRAHSLAGRVWQENWATRRRSLVRELQGLPRPAAVFAYNDCVAADVIDACRDGGLRVPEEIAVLGVDDDPYVCDCAPVPLSSVRHDIEGMAYAGAALLERLMRGRPAPRRVVRVPPHGVVTRASTDMRAVENVNVAIALRFLADRFRDPHLSVADVVQACGLGRRQLERAFRAETRSTIHGELTRVRIQHALRELAETDKTVGEVGREAGFARPAGFFRTFRRLLRSSPNKYRARQRRPLSRRASAVRRVVPSQ
jgi:LacI family transcriptional regulator, galactose operon repressor